MIQRWQTSACRDEMNRIALWCVGLAACFGAAAWYFA